MNIKTLNDLHGAKSKCGKFVTSVDKGYLIVACNFHDRARIVYSESIDNVVGILQDLKVFNFPQYKIVAEECVSTVELSILYDKDGAKVALYDKKDNKICFYQKQYYELFYFSDCWDTFTNYCGNKFDCKVVEL